MYHVVLIPPPHVAKAAIDFAKTHFLDGNMGYCLGNGGALPHVTLAQLRKVPEEKVSQLFTDLSHIKWRGQNILEFGEYYHRTDKPYNGINIHMSKALRDLHNQVVDVCHGHDLSIENAIGDDYWPHLTFSKNPNYLPEPVQLSCALKKACGQWCLELGRMGDHGVYLGRHNLKNN